VVTTRRISSSDKLGAADGFEEIQDYIGLSLLFTAVFFLLYTISPIIANPGYINGGDNFVHTAEIYYMDRLFTEDGSIFGWYHIFNTGHPLFYFYQSLFHIIVVVLHKATALELLIAEKVVLTAVISFYPIGLFYFLNRVGYSKLISGIASLFVITSNAAWGNNITTYLFSGAITGAMGMLFFPLVLALFYDSFMKNRGITALLVALVLSMLAHYLVDYMLWIVLNVFLVLMLVRCDFKLILFSIKKYAIVILAFILLASFHVIPMLNAVLGQSVIDVLVRNGWYEGWYQNSFTIPETVNHYLKGHIFDIPTPEMRKYNWYDNSKKERWPLLTFFSLVGFVYCVLKPAEKQNSFFSIGLLLSILLYSGDDDAIFLKVLPFQNHLWYIRTILVFEFFVVILAAIGVYQLSRFFVHLLTLRGKKRGLDGRRAFLLTVVVFVLCIGVFGHLLSERYKVSLDLARVVDNEELSSITELFKNATYDHDARMFVGHELDIKTSHEKYTVFSMESKLTTIMPPDWEQMYYTQQLLTRLIPQGVDEKAIAIGIPNKPQLMDLYNVKYLLAAKGWGDSPRGSKVEDKVLLANNSRFEFYGMVENYTYFKFITRKPALAVASEDSWFGLGLQWLYGYQKNESYYMMPFIVRSKTQFLDDVDFDVARYPAVILLDYDVRDRDLTDDKIRRYVNSGGQIISWENINGSNGSLMRDYGAWMDVLLPKTTVFDGVQRVYNPVSGMQRFGVDYHADATRFIVFKMSYFSGWKATVDGNDIQTVDVTPGFVGMWVPPGDHRLELVYKNGDYAPYLLLMMGIILVYYVTKKGIILYKGGVDRQLVERAWIYSLIVCGLLVYIGAGYVLQEYYYMPVNELPATGGSYSTYRTPLIWDMRPLNNEEEKVVKYEVQVSGCPVSFGDCIVFNSTTTKKYYYLDYDKFKPGGVYAWRVRAMIGDKAGVWSIPDVFMTHKNAPNIGNVFPAL
jgi:hypothetical protein